MADKDPLDTVHTKLKAWTAEDAALAEIQAKDPAAAGDKRIVLRRQRLREMCRIARIRIARAGIVERLKREPNHDGLKARLAEYDAELDAIVE